MTISNYFNHYFAHNEQNLIENMVIESIQIQGLDMIYIPRSQDNIDYLYSEDPSNYFKTFNTIEMYPVNVEGLDGDELMSIFGNEFKKNATFAVSKKRFEEETDEKPKEGDLLFMPVTNTLFEIMYVNKESPYFEKGKKYTYELKVETFEYSYEDIETTEPTVDDLLKDMIIDDPEFDIENFGDNEDLETDTEDDIVFNVNNPFTIGNKG